MTYTSAAWHVHEDFFVEDDDDTRYRIASLVSSSSSSCASSKELEECAQPLRETNGRSALQEHAKSANSARYVHVPHRDKPPQVVAKRNARERRRVQAVNGAFVRLRKAVPFENNRGKRVSKVKTLQYAIDYIQKLQDLLRDYNNSQNMQYYYNYYPSPIEEDFPEFSDNFALGY
ncbi:achaete-scute complex protein T3-like [Atheta coriaria]|uniref:achaete-scute complex protein T3-like n=1 Tax=Dalotia coriaria TaxID=877792 RepID=UPI0031F33C01